VAEAGDGLRDVVLEDAEGVLVEGLDAAAGAVEDGGVEADLVGVGAQRELAACAALDGADGSALLVVGWLRLTGYGCDFGGGLSWRS
jgi:hypothetical protein